MRCVILGSAEIKNYEKISRFINPADFIIACDGGLNHVEKLGLSPSAVSLVVGDFDSFPRDKVLRQAQLITADVNPTVILDNYSYFSLMVLGDEVSGITIKNAKYPLENATIENTYQLGVSKKLFRGYRQKYH